MIRKHAFPAGIVPTRAVHDGAMRLALALDTGADRVVLVEPGKPAPQDHQSVRVRVLDADDVPLIVLTVRPSVSGGTGRTVSVTVPGRAFIRIALNLSKALAYAKEGIELAERIGSRPYAFARI